MIARPKLKERGGHYLGLNPANVAADRDGIDGRFFQQMVASQPELGNCFEISVILQNHRTSVEI
jgi:hypothetical protein